MNIILKAIKRLKEIIFHRKRNLQKELQACQVSAEEGYKLAQEKYNAIKNTLWEATERLSKTDKEQSKVNRIQNTKLVENQKRELQRLKNQIDYDLQNLHKRTKYFSIVVYGRTETGKSTLMEILTRGDGKSIGKGRQRTTKDVRAYDWKGLKIMDVPGVCAFGGEQDEKLALEAAKSADLILFLLTSDAPQPDEAEKLAQLKSLGKTVLGIINVKMNFNINDELDIEDLQEKLADTKTINDTINQFKQFASKYNQDWSNMKFVATHLLSAYQAQDKNPKVFKLSRFAEVEDFILDKVCEDGKFLRIKTFADSIAVPMSNVILKIYEYSGAALLASDIWFNKRQQLIQWREKFIKRSQERLDNLQRKFKAQLDGAIDDFVDHHYEDKKAGEHWQNHFESLKFNEKYQKLLKDLADECERKRKELSDELKQELYYTFDNDTETKIQLDDTTPWGQRLSGVTGAIGGVALAAVAAELATGALFEPIGIALSIAGFPIIQR